MAETTIDLNEYYRTEMARVLEKMAGYEPGTDEYADLQSSLETFRKGLCEVEKIEIEVDRKSVDATTAETKAETESAKARAEEAIARMKLDFEKDKFSKEHKMEKIKIGVTIGGTVVTVAMSIWTVCYITAMNLKGEIPDKVLNPLISKMINVIGNLHL